MTTDSLRVISIDFPFADKKVIHEPLDSARALFDFDVVEIRPQRFVAKRFDVATYDKLHTLMLTKKQELWAFFAPRRRARRFSR